MDLQVGGWMRGRSKCQKHRVSTVEIEALFVRGPGIAPDPKHSADEDRLIAVGKQARGGLNLWLLRCAQVKGVACSAR